jgi:hypothetical protein
VVRREGSSSQVVATGQPSLLSLLQVLSMFQKDPFSSGRNKNSHVEDEIREKPGGLPCCHQTPAPRPLGKTQTTR